MGWGTSKGAKPQPAKPKPAPLQDGDPMGKDTDGNGVYFDASRREPYNAGEPLASDEKPTEAAKAQLAWHKLKSQKGWTDATLVMLMYEFIQSRALFADLVTFTRKR